MIRAIDRFGQRNMASRDLMDTVVTVAVILLGAVLFVLYVNTRDAKLFWPTSGLLGASYFFSAAYAGELDDENNETVAPIVWSLLAIVFLVGFIVVVFLKWR